MNKKNKQGRSPLVEACQPPYTDTSDENHHVWLDMTPATLLLRDKRLNEVKAEDKNMMMLMSDLIMHQCKDESAFSAWNIVDPDQILHFVRHVILQKELNIMDQLLSSGKFSSALKVCNLTFTKL